MSEPQREAARAIASVGDAEQAVALISTIIDRLSETLSEETTQVRTGRMLQAGKMEANKVELARAYASETVRLAGGREFLRGMAPAAIDALRQRHLAFQQILQVNLTVLATAHAVSEGIIRGVSGELARKRAPQTYGASGRANTPSPRATQPLALSRKL